MKLLLTIGVTILAMAVLAPLAAADPASHPHDYLATVRQERVSSIPPDLRDHRQIKQLDRLFGNPFARGSTGTGSASSFSWSDAGVGAGATAGVIVLLSSALVLAIRRRARLAV